MVLILQILFQELNMKKLDQILKTKSVKDKKEKKRKRFLMLMTWLKNPH